MKVVDFINVNGSEEYSFRCWGQKFKYTREQIIDSTIENRDIHEIEVKVVDGRAEIIIELHDDPF